MKKILFILLPFLFFTTACEKDETLINQVEELDFSGHYEAEDGHASIDLLFLENDQIKMQGEAYWQGVNPENIHIGNFAGFAGRNETYIIYKAGESEYDCVVEIFFQDKNHLMATDNNNCGGANVTFAGNYILQEEPSDWSLFDEFIFE